MNNSHCNHYMFKMKKITIYDGTYAMVLRKTKLCTMGTHFVSWPLRPKTHSCFTGHLNLSPFWWGPDTHWGSSAVLCNWCATEK